MLQELLAGLFAQIGGLCANLTNILGGQREGKVARLRSIATRLRLCQSRLAGAVDMGLRFLIGPNVIHKGPGSIHLLNGFALK